MPTFSQGNEDGVVNWGNKMSSKEMSISLLGVWEKVKEKRNNIFI